ncbi:GDSL esterase/lipase 5 [Vigna radiata var. radiata]|uniref:GDSL esterase/lipase 5 n=1 Tax=Vigna radiata var. radiata TaxID=3916 RepID=A0A1S3VAU8_VIGRR|nr:GDSL esterase/lipase 5 [Vigna radiata var. radiata]
MATLRVFVVLVLFVLNIHHSHSENSTIFIFGDSLHDYGNTKYFLAVPFFQGNFHPYGLTFFNFPTGRISDGRFISDVIVRLSKSSRQTFVNAFRLSGDAVNFYVLGARGALIETKEELVMDLTTQGSYFTRVSRELRQQLGEDKARRLLSTAVYIFSVGANDYSNPINVTFPYSQQNILEFVIGNITTVIKGIYNEDGRKSILNLPALSCVTSLRPLVNGTTIEECVAAQASALARLHNITLSRSFQNLARQLSGFKYSIFNFYDILQEMIKYPSKYGFKEGSVACCGDGPYRGDYSCGGRRGIEEYKLCSDPGEYVFFESLHPSDKANEHFAQLMWNGTRDVIESYNLKQLFNLE